jgi:hypothetical protein
MNSFRQRSVLYGTQSASSNISRSERGIYATSATRVDPAFPD